MLDLIVVQMIMALHLEIWVVGWGVLLVLCVMLWTDALPAGLECCLWVVDVHTSQPRTGSCITRKIQRRLCNSIE